MKTLSESDIFKIAKAAFVSDEYSKSISCITETEDYQNWLIINLEDSKGIRFPRVKIPMRHARNKNLLEKKLLNIRGALEDIGYQLKPFVL